jgi:predicted nucleic acid-binding protein
VLERHYLSSRDALHAAVMARHEVRQIMSFDAAFDSLPGLTRIR